VFGWLCQPEKPDIWQLHRPEKAPDYSLLVGSGQSGIGDIFSRARNITDIFSHGFFLAVH